MTLHLRQYADASPDVGWPRDGSHFVVTSGAVRVGSIKRIAGGLSDSRWHWSITALDIATALRIADEGPSYGDEASQEAAMRAFAAAWRAWLARAELVELTPAETSAEPEPPK